MAIQLGCFAVPNNKQEASIRFIMKLTPKDWNETNLPVFFAAAKRILHCQNCCEKYIKEMESKVRKNHPENLACSANIKYDDLLAQDWNESSYGPKARKKGPSLDANEPDIKIIISDQDSGTNHEKEIKPSTSLKSFLCTYAEERDVSLRSLRFMYNGRTLFVSSLGSKSAKDLGINHLDTIQVCNNNSSQPSNTNASSQEAESKKKKPKSKSGKKSRQKKPNKPTKPISIPLTEEQLKEAHSVLLSKIFEEADPMFRAIRQKLNNLTLEHKRSKKKSRAKKKRHNVQNTQVVNPSNDGLGGKAGKPFYAINVGQVENLYISSKHHPKQSTSSVTQYSLTLDLHGCTRDEAVKSLETALVDWMDAAMKGEYPWVIPAVIVCGGGNQILSETVEAWIREKKNVANAPKRS